MKIVKRVIHRGARVKCHVCYRKIKIGTEYETLFRDGDSALPAHLVCMDTFLWRTNLERLGPDGEEQVFDYESPLWLTREEKPPLSPNEVIE